MNRHQILALSLTLSLATLGGASCSSTSGGGSGGAGGGSAALKWYTTCGDPVCSTADAGAGGSTASPCTTEKAGDACTTAGNQCDPGSGCNVHLICATSDPKMAPGGCPISRARFKKDIDYVPDQRLQSIHDELMTMRLATWRYTSEAESTSPHLGFIIDDNPASASVDATGDRVDLYGYTSMAVAAAQVQNKRIEALERELRSLREELGALRRQKAAGGR
jgi:hypothetical protein